MFLRNSVSLCIFAFWIFLSSLNPFASPKVEIEIPQLNYQRNLKPKENSCIMVKEDLDALNINDKFTIKEEDATFYYKVIAKYEKGKEETLPSLEENELLLVEENPSTLQMVIIAINTGKLVKNGE